MVSVPDALEDVICNLINHFRELIQVLERSGYKESFLRILRPVPGKNQSQPDSALLRRADHSGQRLVDEDDFVHSLNVEDKHTLPCMHILPDNVIPKNNAGTKYLFMFSLSTPSQ